MPSYFQVSPALVVTQLGAETAELRLDSDAPFGRALTLLALPASRVDLLPFGTGVSASLTTELLRVARLGSAIGSVPVVHFEGEPALQNRVETVLVLKELGHAAVPVLADSRCVQWLKAHADASEQLPVGWKVRSSV